MDFDKLPEWLVQAGMEGRNDGVPGRRSSIRRLSMRRLIKRQRNPAPQGDPRPTHPLTSSSDVELMVTPGISRDEQLAIQVGR